VAVRVEFLPAAVDEAEAAAALYFERDPRVAAAFARAVAAAVKRISLAPGRWPSHLHGTRRVLLRLYPFSVVYRAETNRVLVVAIAHFRQRPGYWADR